MSDAKGRPAPYADLELLIRSSGNCAVWGTADAAEVSRAYKPILRQRRILKTGQMVNPFARFLVTDDDYARLLATGAQIVAALVLFVVLHRFLKLSHS